MKVTIQLREDLRATLQEIAAQRGERGISRIVQEAVVRYIAELERAAAVERDPGRIAVLRGRAFGLIMWLRARGVAGCERLFELVRARFASATA